jgi:hypothetical protein
MSTTRITHGIYGGLVGGGVFGMLMAMMGMLPMIGGMVGIPSALAGFVVHLVISAAIGGSFAVLLDASGQRGGIASGLGYGFAWWILGPLTLMPLFMGMGLGVNWNLAAMTAAMPSLMGHLIFGAILGASYRWFEGQAGTRGARHAQTRAA